MNEIPIWMWDVLADLVNHEDIHAKGECCAEPTLARVPATVLAQARAIAQYRAAHIVDAEIAEETA